VKQGRGRIGGLDDLKRGCHGSTVAPTISLVKTKYVKGLKLFKVEELLIRQPWTALPLRVFATGFMLLFAGIGAYSVIAGYDDSPSYRLVLPLYAVGVYAVTAMWLSKRTAKITPAGVRVSIGPLPVCTPRSVTKDKILHCYVHTVRIYDDGTELENYDSVGVEALDGEQINISGPHLVAGEAMEAARQIARVLAPLGVQVVDWEPSGGRKSRILKIAAFWLALSLLALFAGTAWELELWL